MDRGQIAQNRFGLGRRSTDTVPADPRGWLLDQFGRFDPLVPQRERLASRAEIVADVLQYREERAKMRAAGKQAANQTPAATPGEAPQAMREQTRALVRDQHVAQVGARTRAALESEAPFVERLVHFWANHFAVSADGIDLVALTGLMEFEAIRPHVLGRFEDMLVAVERHPAMLLYLDQTRSVGPNSGFALRAAARDRKIGLNENLGREILELHTLGVRSGYGQADVTELARALTGWSVAGAGRGRIGQIASQSAGSGDFVFVPAIHEPGSRKILGKTYPQQGEDQARAVLGDVARHPATARFLATKLARHFVADDPPTSLIERLERAYLSSGGDLPTVYRALIDAPEAWNPAPAKFRMPWQWMVAVLRAVPEAAPGGAPQAGRRLVRMFAEMGQPVWRPGSPAGYDDVAVSWAAPDALHRRVELANQLAQLAPATLDPRKLASDLFGDGLTRATREAVARADGSRQGLALLLVSPEMLRV